MPLYSIVVYKHFLSRLNTALDYEENDKKLLKDFMMGREVHLVKKCLKSIESEIPKIMKKKGCDASNFFDEEPSGNGEDIYFSDDEAEREYKREKKNKNKTG